MRNLEVLPAAEVRARGRRRGRRQLAVLGTAAAVVTVTAGVAFAWPAPDRAPAAGGPASGTAAAAGAAVGCVLTLPDSPARVRVRVLDGGAPAELRAAIAAGLTNRDFTVVSLPAGTTPVAGTVMTYGPASIGSATVLRAALLGETTMRFDPSRRDDTIDLALGPDFERLSTPTEMNRNLAEAGEPTAPPEC